LKKKGCTSAMGADLGRTFERNWDRYLAEWQELLRFPSISAERAHDGDCLACAEWLVRHLAALGFASQLLPTPGKPAVFAERQGAPASPVVLFYGHYDVQPVDPLAEWVSPPFVPAWRDGRLYARGAQDNKGQLLFFLKAVETLCRQGGPMPTVKIVIEGEEESGSVGILRSLDGWRARLKADVLMVTDTGQVASLAPTIVMGLRGIIHLTAVLSGLRHDLHSGVHGGRAPNAAQGMAELVASLHHPDGRVAVAGFYDSVAPPTPRERSLAGQVPFDAAAYESQTGVPPVAGEPEFSPVERVGFRPSVDVNGIHAGFGGEGSKTVIPACAVAKITARLVPAQDPARCLNEIIAHLQAHTPAGLRLEIPEQCVAGGALRLDPDSALVAKAKAVLDALGAGPTAFLWDGASVPVVAALSQVSGAEPLLVGFGREEDRIHAPNESFSREQFRLGFLYAAAMLTAL
jgi:acetylornithine deacetylase/succinyl-diaminopimelate desuccinylase-like protein